ncbi:glycoside hydrolase family 30 beta sandwich domain-containing protein [Fulvimonas sp. R45]|uniref:glycoside hydrolase family 30 protein n=1 Tax=Fulvimonas sp. R45 TaxID=3045937 RepID=UPI00265E6955|nr:glycoside hydrolase family 30 beta sandwich domain-containing protein [Fulvimonas sp. R45]MDO1529022.1 glycoside hydrolase family 30 beta sandwich domain-containing protein [Fulvimonas sp. R45]
MDEGRNSARWTAVGLVALLTVCALAALRLPVRLPPAPAPLVLPAMPSGPVARFWLSTQDRRLRLARQPDVPVLVQAPDPTDIVVDTGRTYQTIVGFGAALTDASAWLIRHRLNALQRGALLEELFGPPPGLGLNMLRLTIGASDFSLKPYTLDDLPAGQVDPELQHFNITAELPDVVPTVREILAIDPQLHVIASPWSAPAWMKSSGNLIGGTLLEPYEQAYAQYLVKYVDAFRGQGIPVWALTVQNEPAFLPLTYPGMELPADARARIIGQYLGPALAGRTPRTRILGWDHNWDMPEQPLAVLADPDAARYVDGIAWHCYRGDPAAQGRVHSAFPHKDAYVTECSGGDWESARNGELLWFARDLLLGGLRNWARGVVYWNLALDEQHGPHAGGCDNCKGMVLVDSRTGEVRRNDEYYAFAHYSRFVRPGAVRVWSTATGPDLNNVAFRNADGSVVLVVVNSTTGARRIGVGQGKVFFEYAMPAESVATLVWNPDRPATPWEERARKYLGKLLDIVVPDKAAGARDGSR